jgi:hypothetical protein
MVKHGASFLGIFSYRECVFLQAPFFEILQFFWNYILHVFTRILIKNGKNRHTSPDVDAIILFLHSQVRHVVFVSIY